MDKNNLIRVCSYLLVSARGCIDEPKIYGSLRLIDGCLLLLRCAGPDYREDPFYGTLGEAIEGFKDLCLSDEGAFVRELDKTIQKLTDHIVTTR